MKPVTEIANLRILISKYNHAYYTENASEVSDEQYDALMNRLLFLEREYPDLKSEFSPTVRVGSVPLASFSSVLHEAPMLSLSNVFSQEDFISFNNRIVSDLDTEQIAYSVEPKLDGVSLSLVYRDSMLVQAATRGDGVRGEDVTSNARTIRSIPLKLHTDESINVEIRGEVFFMTKNFQKMNLGKKEAGESVFANPRNATSGSLRQLDSSVTASRPLSFMAYATGFYPAGILNQNQLLKKFHEWGFVVNPKNKICTTTEQVIEAYDELVEVRSNLPMEIDGMVIKLNDFSLRDKIGSLARAPKWATAWKFHAEEMSTALIGIEVQVGRTGRLTPVARLEPVQVGGVVVTNATLHNQEEIIRKDVRVGDIVLVRRAGDVIPEVVKSLPSEVSTRGQLFSMPDKCPVCNGPVAQPDGEINLYCINPSCSARLQRSLEHWASRKSLDIDGLGEKLCGQLVNSGMVKTIADLYNLEFHALTNMERMGELKVTKLFSALEKSKTVSLSRFLTGLGIPGVGEVVSRDIAGRFMGLEALGAATEEELIAIKGVGHVIATSIIGFFSSPITSEVIQQLVNVGFDPVEEEKRIGKILAGETIVFTGSLQIPRQKAKELAQMAGGKVTGSITGKTTMLVIGENVGSKLGKAKTLGVKIVSENDFIELVSKEQRRIK